MKKSFSFLAAIILTASVFAQAPQKMSYQAVIRDVSDNLVPNQMVGMQISILQGSASGTSVYTETQTPTTNANGLVSIEIGTGATSDDFSTIDWANGPYFIKTETDPAGGTSYSITGTSQLLSVPYALHAKTAESISGGITETDPVFVASPANGITNTDITNWDNKLDTEIDGDITNEIQDLQLNGNILTITNNGTATNIDLSQYLDDTDTQLTETEVDLMVSNNGYLTSEVDGDITNEIQDLQLIGNILTITNNGTATNIDLSIYLDNTDTQLTETEVDLMVSNNGYLTSEIDGSISNEIQILSISNDTIYLTNGGFAKLPAGFSGDYNDLTNQPTIPTVPSNVSVFTNDAGYLTSFTETDPKIGANTSGYSPKWNSSEMVTGAIYQDASNNVGIGTTTPSTKLEVSGQVKITGGTPGAGKILTSDAGGLASWEVAPGDNLGNHTATQNININGFALVSGGTRGLKMDSRGNIGINMNPQNTSSNDVNLDILSPDGWGHANVNLRGYNWATNSYKCTRGSGCDFYSGAWWSDTYNEHLFYLCSDGAEFAKGITIRKNSNVGIGTQAPSTKLDVNGVITATGGNSTSWNAAFGWGNHALAGYLTTEVDGIIGNEVTNVTNTTLTRSGAGTTASPYTLGLNLANANTWTALQTFSTRIISTVATGNAPFTIASTTLNTNLNADMLDGLHATSFMGAATGTTNYVAKFSGANSIANSQIFDNGTNVGIGTSTPAVKLDVVGDARIQLSGASVTPLTVQALSSTATLDQNFTTGTGSQGYSDWWQSFTAGVSGKISSFDAYLGTNSLNAGTWYLYEGNGTGGTLLATGAYNFPAAGGSQWRNILITGMPFLTAGQMYTFRMSNAHWMMDPGAGYAQGNDNASWDRAFRTYMLTVNSAAMVVSGNGNVGIGTSNPTSKLQIIGLPVYANNAAAITGGLTAGALYRTGGDPDVVCVVH